MMEEPEDKAIIAVEGAVVEGSTLGAAEGGLPVATKIVPPGNLFFGIAQDLRSQ